MLLRSMFKLTTIRFNVHVTSHPSPFTDRYEGKSLMTTTVRKIHGS